MTILVAYHSRTGHCQRVANQLVRRLGAASHRIRATGLGPGLLGYQRCLTTVLFGHEAALGMAPPDLAQYDLVVLGTPIWAWRVSTPVRSFARRHAGEIRRCAFFSTSGGPVGSRPFADLARWVGQQPVATLSLTDRELERGAAAARIDAFADRIAAALAPEVPTQPQALAA